MMTRKEWLASQKALELFGNRLAMISLPLMLSATMSMVWFQSPFPLLALVPIAAGLLCVLGLRVRLGAIRVWNGF